MRKMKSKLRFLGVVLMIAGFIAIGSNNNATPTFQVPDLPDLGLYEIERDDGYFTIVDEEGNVLDKTVRVVYIGDEFIAADNSHYRVVEIDGDTAHAEFIGTREIDWMSQWNKEDLPVTSAAPTQGEGEGGNGGPIVIYHTHTAESYLPEEGEPFIEAEEGTAQGGIIAVGEALSNRLNELGVETVLDVTPHEPHDANAYHRSRRTVADLMQNQPIAIVDVHRDGVPDPDFYRTEIDGEQVTMIRLVVGRQNQNVESIQEFAEQIKAAGDEIHPGLMHGIFMAQGNYNQDMHPRSILIESGTHVTSREEAERGAALFADALAEVLGVAQPGGPEAPAAGGDTRSIGWIIGLSLLAGGLFLLVSTGSLSGAVDKFKQFTGEEWANFLGRKIKDRKKGKIYQSSLNRKAFDLEGKEDAEKMPDNKDNKSDE